MAKSIPQTKIDIWFSQILTNLSWRNKILNFTDLLPLFKDEIVSAENIFLFLHKSGYIGSHNENIKLIQQNLLLKIPTSMNDLRFHVVHEEAEDFIYRYKLKENENQDPNQLTLF